MNKNSKRSITKSIFLIIIILLAAAVYLQRNWIYDFYRGITYQPSSEMLEIRKKLNLTGRGELIFNASHPILNNEEDFNINCKSFDGESAILGCYTERNIFVYNITESRLNGIRELTTAHELLHAAYARMSTVAKDTLRTDLEKVYRENQDILKEEIEAYDSEDQLEEIYVRVGTEIKKLPDSLEKHYAEIFKDQDKVVDFYNSYISVFRQLENELDSLKTQLDNLNNEINTKTANYEVRFNQLNAEIDQFNNCADTVGCFTSQYAFNIRRNQLIAEQNNINNLYDEIDQMIDQYNNLVEKYNNNVIENNNLQNIINSHKKADGV